MARLPRKVDDIVHRRTGTTVALRWNKKTGKFQASYAGQTVTSEKAEEVKTKILAMIETGHELTWEPVIELQVRTITDRNDFYGDTTGGGLQVHYRRFYLSRADRLRKIAWDDFEQKSALRIFSPDGYHKRAVDFPCPYLCQRRDKTIMVFPYNEDTWKRLGDLAQTLKALGHGVARCITLDKESPEPRFDYMALIIEQINELCLCIAMSEEL